MTQPTRPGTSLISAMLLASTGGLLDAFVYLRHGHVFASAMTGNGVLFGIALLRHDTQQAVRHIVPAVAFLFGVSVSRLFSVTLGERAARTGLLLEIGALFAISWFPMSFSHMAFTAIVAFVAAYQVSSFRLVDSFAYNSTFITGNLRSAGDGFFESLAASSSAEERAVGRRKLRDFLLVIAGFLLGALAGAWLAPKLNNHTLCFAILPLLFVLVRALPRKNGTTAADPARKL